MLPPPRREYSTSSAPARATSRSSERAIERQHVLPQRLELALTIAPGAAGRAGSAERPRSSDGAPQAVAQREIHVGRDRKAQRDSSSATTGPQTAPTTARLREIGQRATNAVPATSVRIAGSAALSTDRMATARAARNGSQ